MAVGSGSDGPVDRARDALEAGVPWRARDILLDHVERVNDAPALILLGEVLHGMGDLPRAGAVWFAAGVKGPEVDEAVAAWREHSGDDFATMWAALPASVRAEPRPPRIEALRTKALEAGDTLPTEDTPAPQRVRATTPGEREAEDEGDGVDAAQIIAWVLAAVFVVLAVIGAVTALGWIVPST